MRDSGRLKSAADRADSAMFHAAHAALSQTDARPPKTHKGTRTLFARHFVTTQKVPRTLSQDLTFAFDLRQATTYEVEAAFGEEAVDEVIRKAGAFVTCIQQLLSIT